MEPKTTWTIVGVAAAFSVVMAVLLLSGNESDGQAGDLPGLQETEAPWQPEYAGLAKRIQTLGLPSPGTEKFHVHQRLKVYVDGREVTVPANIAFNQQARLAAALHTHNTDGIVHMEADQPFAAKLGDFFTMWGVKFTADQLGSYRAEGDKTVQVFVNGQAVTDGPGYALKAKDQIVVGYGAPGSFPTTIAEPFPADL